MSNNDEGLRRQITLSKKGQFRVTIPKHVGQMLKLRNGDEIEFRVDHEEIIMRKVR